MQLEFLKPSPTQVQINGVTKNFYPLSINATLRLRTLAKPVSQALAALFTDNSKDNNQIHEEFFDRATNQGSTKASFGAVGVDVLAFRHKQKQEAIGALIDALGDETNLKALFDVIADSMRDEFPSGQGKPQEILDFRNQCDLATTVALVKGVIEANKAAFGPLGLRLTKAMETQPSSTQSNGQSPASSQTSVPAAREVDVGVRRSSES